MFRYIARRFYQEGKSAHETLDGALEAAWRNQEFETADPLDIYKGDTLLWTNRDEPPRVKGRISLRQRLIVWAKANGRD